VTFKRKLAVTTIAASVAMSAFAGIPLSSKGLSEKLGFGGVVSAAPLTSQDLINRINTVYNALNVTGGMSAVTTLRTSFETLTPSQKSAIAGPIVSRLVPGSDQASEEKKDRLRELLNDAIALSYSPSVDELEAIREEYVDDLKEYATAASIADLTVDDVVEYFLAVQDAVMNKLRTLNLNAINALITDSAALNDLFEEILAALPGTYAAEQVFLHYGIKTEDVVSVLGNVKDEINQTQFTNAAIALYEAYKYLANPGTGNPGSGIYVPPATIDIPAEVKELEEKFEELAEKLENASDEEKAELIAEAIAEAQALIDKLSDLSTSVTVSGDVATLKLDENKALAAIAGIGAVVAALEEATGATIENLDVTVDFGNVAQDNLVVALSDAVMKKAVEAGLTGIILKVSGLEVKLPVGGTFSNVVDFKINKSEATEEVTGGLPAASDVFEFNLSVGGKPTTTFSKPVQIIFPLGDTTGLDTELLTLAKIVEEGLEFHGGRVKGKTIIENRDSFSSYVVVENSVSFDDTASVDAWAGRAIEVIASKGVIHGKLEGQFDPSAKVTRAQFAKMLVRALDLNNQAAKEKFADVEDDAWYAPYIAAASENGIIYGRSATRFDPHAEVTRAEMATMVARGLKATSGAADIEDVEKALQAFADAEQINETLKQGVAFAAEHSIVVGNGGKFAPNASATRAQAAVIIYRAFNFEV
jgi:hypothetical protein